MASPVVALYVALVAAAAGHSPAPGAGRSYSFRYGDAPPPYSAPGHHWYRYSYGGTVAAPPPAGPPQYARNFGYTGLYGKPYVKIYNYHDSRRRQRGRGYGAGPDYGDYSRAYAKDYDYEQRRGNFKYVREYYKDRYHHSGEHERGRYYPGGAHRYPGFPDERRRRPYAPGRRGPTVIVLGSKKAYASGFPHGGYLGGSSGGYPGGSIDGYRHDDPFPEEERGRFRGGLSRHDGFSYSRDDYPRKNYHGGKSYYKGKSYYGGGGFQSTQRGSGDFPRGGGTSYYGGGGFNDVVPSHGYGHGYRDSGVTGGIGENLFGTKKYYHRDDYRPAGESYHAGVTYHHGSSYDRDRDDYDRHGDYHSDRGSYHRGGDNFRHGSGSYHSSSSSHYSDKDDFYHGGGANYQSRHGNDDGFVSLRSISQPVHRDYRDDDDDRFYDSSDRREAY